jgi:hypothetical protein
MLTNAIQEQITSHKDAKKDVHSAFVDRKSGAELLLLRWAGCGSPDMIQAKHMGLCVDG